MAEFCIIFVRANLRMDGVDLEEVGSSVYLDQEVNIRHSLQPEIAVERLPGDFVVSSMSSMCRAPRTMSASSTLPHLKQ